MTTIKVYGVECESQELGTHLNLDVPSCFNTGPVGWRMKDLTSQQARAQAKREGWQRLKHEGRYSVVMYDVCRICYPLLADALKAAKRVQNLNGVDR